MKSNPTTPQSSTRSGEGNAIPAPIAHWLAASFALVLLVRMVDYSGFAPEIATTFFHFAVSATTYFVNSAGVTGSPETPLSKNRFWSAGCASAFVIAAWIFETMGCGVALGTA